MLVFKQTWKIVGSILGMNLIASILVICHDRATIDSSIRNGTESAPDLYFNLDRDFCRLLPEFDNVSCGSRTRVGMNFPQSVQTRLTIIPAVDSLIACLENQRKLEFSHQSLRTLFDNSSFFGQHIIDSLTLYVEPA